ncbi:hypothetical protein F4777DRAFT_597543 [Nemania sp. FL0916]|nr:hypothetical protein F4777DRAFT_597543 [Nemania sp. FL0916]
MPTTRAAEKNASAKSADVQDEGKSAAGAKHEIQDKTSPESKRVKTEDGKRQLKIEDTLPSPTEAYGNRHATHNKSEEETKPIKDEDDKDTSQDQDKNQDQQTGSAEQPGARSGSVPSSILEKGVIYFFFRGRVNISSPSSVSDIQRSYIILRPLSKDSKLSSGTLSDENNLRLIAVPKKVFPQTGRERWISFVEKTHASLKTLREDFLAESEYETKTVGKRHTPAAQPAAEGVYAITTTGSESHLVYMITLPAELGEVQMELGLKRQGSWVVSTRNPEYEAPRAMATKEGAEYPKDVQDEFRKLRWMPSQPRHFDYVNSQILLIGESSGIEKALEPVEGDKKGEENGEREGEEKGKEAPKEELEKLEDEDTHRMEMLKDSDSAAIFADLGALAMDYPKLETTFG